MQKIKFEKLFNFEKKSKIKAGDGFKLGEGQYPFYTSSNVLTKSIDEYLFENESLIFGTGGLASIHFCNEKFAVSTDCFVTQPKDKNQVFSKFVYYYLSGNIHILENGFKGAGLKHISKDYLQNIEIPLPPLPTQQKIANILDKADELRQYNKQLIEKYDALTQSLFLDMFGDPVKNEKGWQMEKLSKVAPFKRYDGVINKTNGEYWLLNLDMIEQQKGKIIEKKFVLENEINASTISFCENQVLYSKLRPYLNKVLIPDESGYGTSELVPMNPKLGIIDKFFLAYLLRTNNFVNYINDKVAGAKMPRVNMDTLRDFNTITPPIALQNQFAERVAVIEAQKQQAQEALAKSEALFQGLLQQAFNGELN